MALVAHYKLDGNTNDSGVFRLNGTPTSIVYANGKIGQGRSSGYLTIPNNSALQIVGELSICFWIYVNSLTNRSTIIDKAYGGEYTINLEVSGVLQMYAGTAGGNAHSYAASASQPLSINQWYHGCVVRSKDGSVEWYLNGVFNSSKSADPIYIGSPSGNDVRIGVGYTSNNVDAIIDDVRFYNNVLSKAEIYDLSRGKVGHWKLDTDYTDISGNNSGENGVGTIVYSNDSEVSKGSFIFNGSNSYVNLGVTDALQIQSNTPISVCAWIRPTSLTIRDMIFSKSTNRGSPYTYMFGLISGNMNAYTGSAWRGVTTSHLITLNNWHHIAFCYDGTTLRYYHNGVMVDSRIDFSFTNNISRINTIGGYDTNSDFNGNVNDVRVYSTALSDDDISNIYMNRSKLDNIGSFNTHSIIDLKYQPLIMNYTLWENGQTGAVGDFGMNGDASENYRILGPDPWGKETVLWEARPDGTSGADGGWNMNTVAIDNTKMYRFSTWIWRNYDGSGTGYLGLNGYGSVSGVWRRESITTNDTNPYFYSSGAAPAAGQWELWVGHVWAEGSGQGSMHPDSGRYTINGRFGGISRDFVWRSETLTARHRSYLYYCTDTGVRQRWVYPRMEIVDGTEPSIAELLAGHDSRNVNYMRQKGGTSKITLDLLKTGNSMFGNISEVGVVRDLIGWYKLDGNALDSSLKNNNPTTTSPAGWIEGVVNQAASFDGTTGKFIKIPLISSSTYWTISVWVMKRAHTVGSYPIFLSFSLPYIACDSSSSPFRLSFSSGVQTNMNGSTIPQLNVWYHVVGVADSNSTRIYVNGELEGTSTSISTSSLNTQFDIGRHINSDTYRINGAVDDVRIYDRPITDIEVKTLYELGSVKK